MDIDIIEEAQATGLASQSYRKPVIAPVDDGHPFDLEGYISNYTGMSRRSVPWELNEK
jgi:COP9 signalosome complex subunit 1